MAKGTRVQVRYIGTAHRRLVEQYEWNADNGYVQTVTSEKTVERLLANGDFVLVQAPDKEPAEERQEA